MDVASAPFEVVLSHAELAFLLTLFNAAPRLGVDRDPFDGLDDTQIAIAHATARDALRARDLLRLGADDRLLVNDDLLRVLETYTSAQTIVTAYRYAADEELPLAWFGYRRADVAVIHTRPADLLHTFAAAADDAYLAKALVDFCAGGAPTAPAGASLTLPGGVMAAARAYADGGQAAEVAQVLHAAGLDGDTATALAADLTNPAALTAITFAATGGDVAPRRRDAVYWQSTIPATRFIVYAEGDVVQVSSGNETDMLAIFNEMV
jgi:hypothetical protein